MFHIDLGDLISGANRVISPAMGAGQDYAVDPGGISKGNLLHDHAPHGDAEDMRP